MDVAEEAPTPSDIARRKVVLQQLDAAVAALEPEVYRQVIVERDYKGADWEDVRRRLDRPSVAATQELHSRAHIKLRRLYRPDDD